VSGEKTNLNGDGSGEIGSSIDPPRNFKISIEERVRALASGAPAWAVRKRRIEDAIARYERTLRDVQDALLVADAPAERIEAKLLERAKRFDIAKTNALIETHNRYYPIEANLPIDPRTGGYLQLGRPWQREPLVTAEALVAVVRAAAAAPADE
jgi:hypothetical protein